MERIMDTKDELAGLRQFLKTLESPGTIYQHNGQDVKAKEIDILKREIARLETVIAQGRKDA
jgi:ribosomal protein L29